MLLAQPGVELWLESVPVCDDRRRVACPHEVARVDRDQGLARQLLGQSARLFESVGVERSIGVPLHPMLEVPVGLTVTREQDLRHPLTVAGCRSFRSPRCASAGVDIDAVRHWDELQAGRVHTAGDMPGT